MLRRSAMSCPGPSSASTSDLRLQAHLTDATTGELLWSERFDRAISAFFTIQEELGPRILRILPAKVSEAELRRVARRYTRSLDAYEYFLRGQSALLVREKAKNAAARDMFRQRHCAGPGLCARVCGDRAHLRRGLPQSMDRGRRRRPRPCIRDGADRLPDRSGYRGDLLGARFRARRTAPARARRCSCCRPRSGSIRPSPMAMR